MASNPLFQSAAESQQLTPLMRQYVTLKQQYLEALVFFQVGDFYELFFDDAHKAASCLGIVLTKRGVVKTKQGLQIIPLCGVPRHTADTYIVRLIKAGYTVVVCDQIEIAIPGKLVDRAVTQIFTPGLILDDALLQEGRAHYIGVWYRDDAHDIMCWYEPLAGTVFIMHAIASPLVAESELLAYQPEEMLIIGSDAQEIALRHQWVKDRGYRVANMRSVTHENYDIYGKSCDEWINSLQSTGSQSIFQLCQIHDGIRSALVELAAYVTRYLPLAGQTARKVLYYTPDQYVRIDASSMKNLEIIHNLHDGSYDHTLYQSMQKTVTGMGARRLRAWLTQPSRDLPVISYRQNKVSILINDQNALESIRGALKKIGDLERIVGRITLSRGQWHDIVQLCAALEHMPQLGLWCPYDIQTIHDMYIRLRSCLHQEEGSPWKIAPGYDAELDRLRHLCNHGAQEIATLEKKEQERTGMNGLKIRFIAHQGYAFEVTKSMLDKVPVEYQHIQSLNNRDRFTSPELIEIAAQVTRAQQLSADRENFLYAQIMKSIQEKSAVLKDIAYRLAELDVLASFARIAIDYQYVRPHLATDSIFDIRDGRHPVVEAAIQMNAQRFVPNDYKTHERAWIITGPNMGGKSTFLRQVALITLMAHVGSYVPASYAQIPLVDRIYTRIGAGDHVALGKSTFFIEMEETAHICKEATPASLVILDEVGRGTSTRDGQAIAHAVFEFLVHQRPWCLFATHYYELAHAFEHSQQVCLYYAASHKDNNGQVQLLHKIVPGIAQGSFGIDVARAAQLPESIITRAHALLAQQSGTISDMHNHEYTNNTPDMLS